MNPGLQALEEWFEENGIIHSCRIVLDHTGKSVLAAKDLPAGSVVCSVPDKMVILADESPIATYLCEYDMTHEAEDFELERQGLILALMKERLLGRESRFYPYIQSLQSHNFNLPMTWEQGELRRLKGTSLFDKMFQDPSGFKRHLPYAVKDSFESVYLPFASGCLEAGLPTEEAEAWPLYQWATAAVASFSFTLGDGRYPALVPFWDALNHWTGRVNVAKRHDAEQGVLQLVATQDIAEGEEVVNSYGELPSAELLRRYGFVEPGYFNPYACSEIPASWLVSLCRGAWRSEMKSKMPMLHEKLELMRMFQLLPASGFFKIRADGSLQQQLVECVRLLMMKESDFAAFVAQLPTESYLLTQYEPEAQAAVAAARLQGHLWLCMRTIGTLCLALKRRCDGIAWDAEADGELLSSCSQQQQQQQQQPQQPGRNGAGNEEQRSIASAVVRHEERSALNAAFRRLSLILITYADEMGASPSSDADHEEDDAGAGQASDEDQQVAQMRRNLLALLSSAAADDGDEDDHKDGEEDEAAEGEDDDAEGMEDGEDGEGDDDDDAEEMGGEKTPDSDQQKQDELMDLLDAGEDEEDEVKQILIGLQSCPHQVWKRHLLRWFQSQLEALDNDDDDDDDDDDSEDEDYEDGEGNEMEDQEDEEEDDDDDNEEEDDDEDADDDGEELGDDGQA